MPDSLLDATERDLSDSDLPLLPAPQSVGKLAQIDATVILKRYLSGETTTQIAATLGVTRQGLDYHLRKNHEEDFKDAQVILALERKQLADEAITAATDALALARAREQLRSAQWDLERVIKRIYGPSAEITGKDGGPLQVQIVKFAGNLIEGTVAETPTTPNAALLPPLK